MIDQILIQNFQSHKKSLLEFSPGVNIIIGSSDSGKSAIIRALRWVVYGVPKGDNFRSHWGGDTNVCIDFPEGGVSRIKTNSKNQYLLTRNNSTEKELEFNAIGTEIPVEVSDTIEMDDINLQAQIDRPFLLSETPGQVAQHFNRMAQLEKIDSGLKNVNSYITKINQDIKYKEEVKQIHLNKFETYSFIEEAEKKVASIEDLQNSQKDKETSIRKINSILDKVFLINSSINKLNTVVEAEKPTLLILSLYTNKKILDSKLNAIQTRYARILAINKELSKVEEITKGESSLNSLFQLWAIRKTKRMSIKSIEQVVDKVRSINEKLRENNKNIKALPKIESLLALVRKKEVNEGIIRVIRNCSNSIISFNTRIENTKKLYESYVKEYEEKFPDTCPFCDGKSNHKH